MKLEVCIGNIEDIKIINNFKIDRIELNSALSLGGLSPSIITLKKALELTNIPIITMVRIREGNFIYTNDEFNIMYEEAEEFLKMGAAGIVFGFLNKYNEIDIEKTKKFIELAKKYKKEAIFHRAIDVCKDYFNSLEILKNLGIDRILTSGQSDIVINGLENLKKALEMNIPIIIGSGISIKNISLLKDIGFKEIHGSFSKKIENEYNINFGSYSVTCEEYLKFIENN